MKYDLHTHTYYSDGTASPEELVCFAEEAGLAMLALTDHDTTYGVNEARAAAKKAGLPFLCGAEIEAEYGSKLHVLALGIDPSEAGIVRMLAVQEERRRERNEKMLEALEAAGFRIRPYYKESVGCTTRTHIANALIAAGYAGSVAEAFTNYIGRNSRYFINCPHPTMREVIERITAAGGKAVLAHPHKMYCDHAALIRSLADCGLWGVEVYYPGTTEANIAYFTGLAERHGLAVTCGSDFHGENRKEVTVGCAWCEAPALEESFTVLKELAV